MKRMLSILALLGAFLLMPFVTQAQTEQCTITIDEGEHATIVVFYGSFPSLHRVTSGEMVDKNTTLSIRVTPKKGYEVTHYIVNGTEKPTTSTTLNSEKVEGDMLISAKVVPATPCTVTITQPTEGGTFGVTDVDTNEELNSGDIVDSGTQIGMAVTPAEGYDIEYWLINGQKIKPSTSQFTRYSKYYLVRENVTVSVKFKSLNPPASDYLVTYEQPEGGTLTVKSGYPLAVVNSGTSVKKGASLDISATVNSGYQFKHFLINGDEKVPTNLKKPRIFETANSDMTIAAVIEKVQPCIVTIKPFDHGYLKVAYGSYSNPTEVQNGNEVPLGEMLRVDAYFDDGYELDHFLVDDVETPSESQVYAGIKVVATKAITLSAVARLKAAPQPTTYTVTLGDLPAEQGTFTATYGADNTAVQSGVELPEGTKITFTATAAEGYEFDHWMVDDAEYSDKSNPLVITLAAALKVVPVMKPKATPQPTTYTVTLGDVPAEKGYYYAFYDGLNEIKNGESKAVPAGTEVTFMIEIPKDGINAKYNVTGWSVNGTLVEEVKEPVYKFTPTEDVTVFPVLEKNGTEPDPGTDPTPKGKVTMNNPQDEQGVEHGTISASYYDEATEETVTVADGDEVPVNTTVSFVATPDEGYEVISWKVNGDTQSIEPFADPNEKAVTIEDADGITVTPIVKKSGTADVEYTITMVQPQEGQGTLTAHVGDKTYKGEFKATAGTEIFFSVEPAADYEMYYWLINDQRVDPSAGNPNQLTRKVEGNLKVEPILMSKDAPEPTTYTVTMVQPDATQGALIASYYDAEIQEDRLLTEAVTELEEGTKLTFQVNPEEGYELDYWKINEAQSDKKDNPLNITLESDLKVEPVLKKSETPVETFQIFYDCDKHATITGTADGKPFANADKLAAGTKVVLTATPEEGYEVKEWVDADFKLIPGTEGKTTYTFTVEGTVSIFAIIQKKAAPQPTEAKITLVQPDATQGLLIAYTYGSDGMPLTIVDGMTVKSGTEVTFAVSLKDGYEMDYWMVNDQRQEVEAGEFPHKKTIKVTSDITVKPVLKAKTAPQPKKFEVSYSCGDHATIVGTVNGKPFESGEKLALGTEFVLTVTPEDGYEVKHWIDSDDEVVPGSEGKNSYTFTVDGYTSIVAKIQKKKDTPQYETVHVKVEYESINGSITTTYVAPDGSSQSISGEDDIPVGSVVTLRATIFMPDYQVVYMNNGEVVSKDALSEDGLVYTFTANEDASIQAIFSKKTTPEPTNKAKITFKEEGTGGFVMGKYKEPESEFSRSIFNGDTKDLPIGTVITFTATLLSDAYQVTYTNNGEAVPAASLSEEGTVYTLTVKGDATVLATFSKKEVPNEDYTFTFEGGKGGTVTATVLMEPIESGTKIAAGTMIRVEATPDENYEIDEWRVNDELVSTNGKNYYYVTLMKDTNVKVTFKSTKPVEYAVTVAPVLPSAEAGTVKLYKENGTAVESGTAVAVNTKMYVEVKPAAKYELETLQVNNTTIKAGDAALVNLTDGGFKYSFTVTEATTIKATFKLGGAVEQLTQNQIAAYVTNGGTRLEVTGATEGTEVRLYDYTGQLLLSSTEHALDISALPAGGYIVLVGNYTTRIVK